MLVDSHAHVGARAFARDRDEVMQRARNAGVRAVVDVGSDLDASRTAVELALRYDEVYAVVGYHPHNAASLTEADLEAVAGLSEQPKVVAIGEIGLDFYRNLSPREDQFRAFERQLDLAERLGMPVVIHSRDAAEEVFNVLSNWAARSKLDEPLGVLHCFSGDVDLARRYIDMGFLISIAGPVTYRNSGAAEVARDVPLDRLVIETDCPYLAPQPYRGKRNEPAHVSLVAERIAQLRHTTADEVGEQTALNAVRLFRLPLC